MSVFNTSVSGMLADNNWLSTISQNVANANTTGFKNVETEFSSLVDSSPGSVRKRRGSARPLDRASRRDTASIGSSSRAPTSLS